MVESKIRFLIQILEKNQFITLAHINPQGYEEKKEINVEAAGLATSDSASSSSTTSTTVVNYTTFWFIGLEFKTTSDSAVKLDLTEPIQLFTDRVYMQAQKLAISQPSLDAKYVKRKELKKYLPAHIIKLEATSKKRSLTDQVGEVAKDQSPLPQEQSPSLPSKDDETSTTKSVTTTTTTSTTIPNVTLLKNESKDSFILFQSEDMAANKRKTSDDTVDDDDDAATGGIILLGTLNAQRYRVLNKIQLFLSPSTKVTSLFGTFC
jgi:hypothetical protein